MRNFKTLAEAISDLRQRGYSADFTVDKFCLYCGDLDMRLDPDQFKVDEEYHFEGDASNEEDTVLVAITSSGGIKGIILDSYNACAVNTNLQLENMSPAFEQ